MRKHISSEKCSEWDGGLRFGYSNNERILIYLPYPYNICAYFWNCDTLPMNCCNRFNFIPNFDAGTYAYIFGKYTYRYLVFAVDVNHLFRQWTFSKFAKIGTNLRHRKLMYCFRGYIMNTYRILLDDVCFPTEFLVLVQELLVLLPCVSICINDNIIRILSLRA